MEYLYFECQYQKKFMSGSQELSNEYHLQYYTLTIHFKIIDFNETSVSLEFSFK